jgi:hypothetical protein
VLQSPFAAGIAWWGRWADASCYKPEHAVPVAGCCGWYADIHWQDLVARARAFRTASQLGVVALPYDAWDYLVVGRVCLADVVTWRPPPFARSGNAVVEYQARRCGILELGLLDTDRGPAATEYAHELAARYGVPVYV